MPDALVTTVNGGGYSREQIELIKTTIARGATDNELALFIQTCQRTALDPFARQVFAVKRWDSALGREVMAIQVSIDGFRLIAARTTEYQGQTTPEWCGPDGVWAQVWLKPEPPAAARVGVWRKDFREPAWGVARYSAYCQIKKDGNPNAMWARFGVEMLAKCAESLALRKAFPNELSGLYTKEEMDQSSDPEPARIARPRASSEATVAPEPVVVGERIQWPDDMPPMPSDADAPADRLDAATGTHKDPPGWTRVGGAATPPVWPPTDLDPANVEQERKAAHAEMKRWGFETQEDRWALYGRVAGRDMNAHSKTANEAWSKGFSAGAWRRILLYVRALNSPPPEA